MRVDRTENPVAKVLHCPTCGTQHVDRGEWATRRHSLHLCEQCGNEWRPFSYYTVGVEALSSEKRVWPWWKRLLGIYPPREPVYQDFVTVTSRGAIQVDLIGWYRTEPGKRQLKAELEKSRQFEAWCRANSPDGSFSFYD